LTQDLRKVAEKSYELDALIGLAIAAKDGNFCRPRMISEPSLHIEEGRHPLLGTHIACV
jgi:DNA mismatch repair protein MutS